MRFIKKSLVVLDCNQCDPWRADASKFMQLWIIKRQSKCYFHSTFRMGVPKWSACHYQLIIAMRQISCKPITNHAMLTTETEMMQSESLSSDSSSRIMVTKGLPEQDSLWFIKQRDPINNAFPRISGKRVCVCVKWRSWKLRQRKLYVMGIKPNLKWEGHVGREYLRGLKILTKKHKVVALRKGRLD